jgi:hypothetical protein
LPSITAEERRIFGGDCNHAKQLLKHMDIPASLGKRKNVFGCNCNVAKKLLATM